MSKKDDKAPVVEAPAAAPAPAAKEEKTAKAPAAKQSVVTKNVKCNGKYYKKGDVVTDAEALKELSQHGYLE